MPRTYTSAELAECPTIRVNGKDWPIPIFGPRQNRRIVPCITAIGGASFEKMDTEKIDQLYSMIYWAINRAHPEVEEKDFLDWDIPLGEAMMCIPVIARQTGIMTFSQKDASKGEDKAAGKELTGTSLSPELPPGQDGLGTK